MEYHHLNIFMWYSSTEIGYDCDVSFSFSKDKGQISTQVLEVIRLVFSFFFFFFHFHGSEPRALITV